MCSENLWLQKNAYIDLKAAFCILGFSHFLLDENENIYRNLKQCKLNRKYILCLAQSVFYFNFFMVMSNDLLSG